MKFKAQAIADMIGGKIEGNPEIEVHTLSRIEEGEAGSLTFLANPKYTPFIYQTKASVVIVSEAFTPEQALVCTLIRVKDPYSAFATLLEQYNHLRQQKNGISSLAFIHPEASVSEEAYVGEFAFVGAGAKVEQGARVYPQVYLGENVKVGAESTLFPGVRVYADCVIGAHCTIHAGAVIGADGFGFAPQDDQQYRKVAQIGNVIIEDYVEIGANTTIDRATLGSTFIRKGVKLDNLIQVAHNVDIGENTVIAAQTGIAGSTRIGRNCMFAGQVGIIGHIEIADGVKIAAQSGISGSIRKADTIVMGSPAYEHGLYRKSYIYFRKLPELVQRIEALEVKLKTFLPGEEKDI